MGVGQVLTMPLFFASSAIYPLDRMPEWLRTVARFNPLTYLVDALRGLMVPGDLAATHVALDLGILTVISGLLMVIAVKLRPGLVQ
jgi:ABC-2 type transport system permease protein